MTPRLLLPALMHEEVQMDLEDTISFRFCSAKSLSQTANVSKGLRTIMEASCMPNEVFILPAVKREGHGCLELFGNLPS